MPCIHSIYVWNVKKKNQTCAQNIQSSEIQNAAKEKQIQGMTHLKLK